MKRLTILAALAACATPSAQAPALGQRVVIDGASVATSLQDTDVTVFAGAPGADRRVALHAGGEGHDAAAVAQPPAFAGLVPDGPQRAALTADLASAGWRETEEALVHGPSGLSCPWGLSFGTDSGPLGVPLREVRVYDERGNDTSCNYFDDDRTILLTGFVSNWPEVRLEDHFEQAARLMTRDVPFGEGAKVPVAVVTDDAGRPVGEGTRGAAFTTPPIGGQTYLTSLWLNRVGPWHGKRINSKKW